MATELSADRKEFARLCGLEIQKAAKLSGGRLPDLETVRVIALDMASSSALNRIPCQRVGELFSHARANYSETPILRHLVKSAQAIKPIDAPAPTDSPRLPPPKGLQGDAGRLRKLAAVRTCIAEGGAIMQIANGLCGNLGSLALRQEPWMEPLLDADPTREETQAMIEACPVGVAWFLVNDSRPPFWGRWLREYGLVSADKPLAQPDNSEDEDWPLY